MVAAAEAVLLYYSHVEQNETCDDCRYVASITRQGPKKTGHVKKR